MNQYYSINIPKNIKIVVWKNENNYKIMLLSDHKIIKLFFSKNSIKIDKWSNSIVVYKNNESITAELIKKKMDNFLKSLSVYFFTKIKFKGKGFRIKFFKKIKLIKFYFGRSHKTFVILKGLLKKKISKYKFLLFYIKKSKNRKDNF